MHDIKIKQEEISNLKRDLSNLIDEFDIIYFKTKFQKKKIKIKDKVIDLPNLDQLFPIIKQYLNRIEDDLILVGFIKALKKEVKVKDYNGVLFGKRLMKIKNTKKESFNWVYYALFKSIADGLEPIALIYKKTLDTGDLNHLKTYFEKNKDDFNLDIFNKELKELGVDDLLKAKLYRKYLKDFHKTIMSWLELYKTSVLLSPSKEIKKDPLAEKWEDITLKFNSKHIVELIINNKTIITDYEKLGFADKRQDSDKKSYYVKSWRLLLTIAYSKKIPLSSKVNKKEKSSLTKQKKDLNKRLKLFFNIENEPIVHCAKKNEYYSRINLIPTKEFRDDWLDKDTYD
jgi:hypothetical protein